MRNTKNIQNNSDFTAKEKTWYDILHKISTASGTIHMIAPNFTRLTALLIDACKVLQTSGITQPRINEKKLEALSKSIASINTARMSLAEVITAARDQKVTTTEDIHNSAKTLSSISEITIVIRMATLTIKDNFPDLLADYNTAVEKNLTLSLDDRDLRLLNRLPECMIDIDKALTIMIDLTKSAQDI